MFLKLAMDYDQWNKAGTEIEIIGMKRAKIFGSEFGVLSKLNNKSSAVWLTVDWFFMPESRRTKRASDGLKSPAKKQSSTAGNKSPAKKSKVTSRA